MWTKFVHRDAQISNDAPIEAPQLILIVAIACASVSLIAAILTIRWFVLMKRSFRHHLIMLLIISDMFKAVWFFVVPVVVLIRGTAVSSSSSFCQASGFFLAQATEASDLAALTLALHLVTCIFRPPKQGSQRGLSNFRLWIYILWGLLPILAASLAFVNTTGSGYTSYGAFCYLPGHPIWYKMALAWIPRYIVFLTIFSAALIVTIHVHIKFQHFGHVNEEDQTGTSESRMPSLNPNIRSAKPAKAPSSAPTRFPSAPNISQVETRHHSQVHSISAETDASTPDLLSHRHTIERHLRILFLYPVSYLTVWILPFVSQCLLMTGKQYEQQPYALRITTTGVLALQASVDAAVFSYREKPWTRARGESLTGKLKDLLRRHLPDSQDAGKVVASRSGSVTLQETINEDAEVKRESLRTATCWWEEEGRKRRDSVWMRTENTLGNGALGQTHVHSEGALEEAGEGEEHDTEAKPVFAPS